MADEIVKFDPSKLVDQVRDRIRNTFAELIPEDEWRKLVQREIDDFLKPRTVTRNSYGNEIVSDGGLSRIVREELSKMLSEFIKKELQRPEWNSWWNGQEQRIGVKMKAMIVESAPEILFELLGRLVTFQLQSR